MGTAMTCQVLALKDVVLLSFFRDYASVLIGVQLMDSGGADKRDVRFFLLIRKLG